MKFYFHPDAKLEFNETIDYYEECQTGLGLEFSKEVYATIQLLINYPMAWPKLSKNTRKCLTTRFPFGIIYRILDNEIFIIAVSQLNRRPDGRG